MGNLHKWFNDSKSSDGKGGWVNVKTGGTCASDEPGEGTPKCVSSKKRASMTPAERESASRRKKAADPNQQQKSGAAKPTYVSTDKPKKMKKEQFSNWRDDYVATEHESFDVVTPEPMKGLSETKEGLMKVGREQYKKEKEAGRYGGDKPSNERVAKLMKKLKEEKKESERKDAMPEGDVGHDIHKRAVAQYNKQNPSKKVKEEVEISEEDKKGKGSGKKDACYHKVKASASVWPSAYASGRLVQCRKKGAANYGKSKNEEFSAEGYKGKHGMSDTEAMDARSDAAKQISGDSKSSGAEYSHRSYRGVGKPAKPGERQKDQGKMTDADRNELAIRKNELKKREAAKKEKLDELKCWKGYKRKKGAVPGAPGSCVKAGYSDWRGELNLMEGVTAWQREFISEEEKAELQKKASRGDKDAMKKLHKLRADGKIGKEPGFEPKKDIDEAVAAWQRKEGKNKAGGLNEKGRKSYERENPGSDLKAPQPEGGPRKKSFCARMSGMKKKLTSKKTANDPNSRINKSLRKWKC